MPILGPDQQEYDKITIIPGINEQSVLGVFPGKGKNSKPHKHINEDMIAQVKTVNNEIISMVADGHNGKDTAETLVTEFPEIIKDTLGRRNDISRDLFISLILLNSKILSEKHLKNMFIPQDLSASTFLTTIQKNDKLYYISVGDSYMYLIDKEGKAQNINEQQIYSGRRPVYIGEDPNASFEEIIFEEMSHIEKRKHAISEDVLRQKYHQICNPFENVPFDPDILKPIIHMGKYDIKDLQDKTILLTTDGIEEERTEINIEEVIYQNHTLLKENINLFAQKLLETFQSTESKEESDNISLIIQKF